MLTSYSNLFFHRAFFGGRKVELILHIFPSPLSCVNVKNKKGGGVLSWRSLFKKISQMCGESTPETKLLVLAMTRYHCMTLGKSLHLWASVSPTWSPTWSSHPLLKRGFQMHPLDKSVKGPQAVPLSGGMDFHRPLLGFLGRASCPHPPQSSPQSHWANFRSQTKTCWHGLL